MSAATILAGLRIAVIEDEFLVAMQLGQMLRDLGAEVVGPASNVAAAEKLLTDSAIDGAVLDMRLGNETSAPLAEHLLKRGVPVILTTGYGEDSLPEGLTKMPRLSKPYTKSGFEDAARRHFIAKRGASSRTDG